MSARICSCSRRSSSVSSDSTSDDTSPGRSWRWRAAIWRSSVSAGCQSWCWSTGASAPRATSDTSCSRWSTWACCSVSPMIRARISRTSSISIRRSSATTHGAPGSERPSTRPSPHNFMHGSPSLIRVVTSAEAAARDRAAIDSGIPSRALMQRAGAATAGEIALRYPRELKNGVLVFAGPGNNGGDAWVVASALAQSGAQVRVFAPMPSTTDDARAERELATPFVNVVESPSDAVYRGEGLVVDGLLGTGSSGAPRGAILGALAAMRAATDGGRARSIAIDLPTGVDATTGGTSKPVRADLTVTYGTLKRGHLLARGTCGRVVVVDIGLGRFAWGEDDAPRIVSGAWVASKVPDVPPDAHKGTRKKIAIVGGGAGMSGAAILAARAAWRSGVGMVKLVVSPESLTAVREAEPQSLTAAWPTRSEEHTSELQSQSN